MFFFTCLFTFVVPCVSAFYLENNTVLGSVAQGSEYYARFLSASRNSVYHTGFPFTGFNFSAIYEGLDTAQSNTNSSETWTMKYNYSSLFLPEQNNSTVGNLVLSLDFPEESLPINNSTDWQLCTHVGYTTLAPNNVTNAEIPNDGNCVPYLGQACYDALLSAFLKSGRSSIGCANVPDFSSIAECNGSPPLPGIASTSIMNFTAPELYYNRSSAQYINSSSDAVASNVSFHGLLPNQPFASVEDVFPSTSYHAIDIEAHSVWFSALSFVVSDKYIEDAKQSHGGVVIPQNNARLFCGRPYMILSTETVSKAAVSGQRVLTTSMGVAVLVSAILYLM